MRAQFLCHWQLAEFAEPGKTSWNLEPWRPGVDEGDDGRVRLQSRRYRGAVLMTAWTREQVAALVDHTLLKPEATAADVAALVDEAAELGVYAVCVSPSMVAAAVAHRPAGPLVAAVAGFPVRQAPLRRSRPPRPRWPSRPVPRDRHGHRRRGRAGRRLRRGARRYRRGAQRDPGAVLKVIIESAALMSLSDASTVVAVCRAAADAGADFVKTSTGFHPAGGASVPAVVVDGRHGRRAPRSEGQRRHPDRRRRASPCSTPVPPGWACPVPAPCSTAWLSAQPVTAPRSRGRRWRAAWSRSGSRTGSSPRYR